MYCILLNSTLYILTDLSLYTISRPSLEAVRGHWRPFVAFLVFLARFWPKTCCIRIMLRLFMHISTTLEALDSLRPRGPAVWDQKFFLVRRNIILSRFMIFFIRKCYLMKKLYEAKCSRLWSNSFYIVSLKISKILTATDTKKYVRYNKIYKHAWKVSIDFYGGYLLTPKSLLLT